MTNDEPTKDELLDRIEELEAQTEQQQSQLERMMPTRRDVVAGSSTLAGAGLLSLLFGTASGSTGDAGPVGNQNNRPDGYLDAVDANSVSTENIGTERHYAGAYDGSDADARLSNAISAATNGDVIYLEAATYKKNITDDTEITYIGTGGLGSTAGTRLEADWSFDIAAIYDFTSGADSSTITVGKDGGGRAVVTRCSSFTQIQIESNNCRVINCDGVDVTFASGTSNGLVDSCTNTTVTDNGANAVGDTT